MAKNLSAMYNQIVNAIIRPPRAEYEADELGDSEFTINGIKYRRDDFQIKNSRNLNLECSHFAPVVRPQKLPCVIYLHGNCGCRLDAMEAVRTLLPLNITVLCFDFSGSGLSQGEYVSLGHFEKQDLISVVNHLRASNSVTRIGLWGRSMGAVTSILYAATDPSMACVVLDSPFSNLRTLAFELLGKMETKIPKTIAKVAFKFIEKSVEKRAKFDIGKLDPIKDVELCFNPSLFAHAEGDDFIDISHSRKLYDKYPGDKNIIAFEGDHNSERPEFFYDSLTIFFKNHLLIESDFGDDNPLPNDMDRKKFLEPTPEVQDNFTRAFRNLKMSDSMSMPHSVQINDMLFGNNFGGGGDFDDDFNFDGKGALPDEDEELRQAIMLSMQSTNVEFLNREGGLFAGGQSTAQNDEEMDWAEEIRRIEEATKREEEKQKQLQAEKTGEGAKNSGSDSPKDKATSNKEPSSINSAVDNSSSSMSGKIVSPRRKESKDKSKDKKEKEKKSKDKSSSKDKAKDKTKDKKEKKDKK